MNIATLTFHFKVYAPGYVFGQALRGLTRGFL